MKQLTFTFILLLFAITANAQPNFGLETNYKGDYTVTTGVYAFNGDQVRIPINTGFNFQSKNVVTSVGVGLTSGDYFGIPIFTGLDARFETDLAGYDAYLLPKIGFTIPYNNSRVDIYTSVARSMDDWYWKPASISISF